MLMMEKMTWAHYVLRRLYVYQQQGLYCDITLQTADGESIPVHACILGACSAAIHQQLMQGSAGAGSHLEIPLTAAEAQKLVDFLYGSDDSWGRLPPVLLNVLKTLGVQRYPTALALGGAVVPGSADAELEDVASDAANHGKCHKLCDAFSTSAHTKPEPVAPHALEGNPSSDEGGESPRQQVAPPDQTSHTKPSGPRRSERTKTDQHIQEAGWEAKQQRVVGLERKDIAAPARDETRVAGDTDLASLHSQHSKKKGARGRSSREPSEKRAKSPVKRSAKAEAPTSVACTYCGKTFRNAWHRLRHERSHTGEKPFQCSFCDKRFSRDHHRKRHENIHTEQLSYQCRFCGESFKHEGRLYYHEMCHSQKHKCSICEKVFPFKSSLKAHMRMHTGERPFQCMECGKSFTAYAVLRDHERAHRGEKNYSCGFCPAVFVRKFEKVVHERIHTNERPLSCRLCGKAFRSHSNRADHERTHPELLEPAPSGEPGKSKAGYRLLAPKKKQPLIHECSFCDKKWSKRSLCLRHEKTHLREKSATLHQCTKCWKSFPDAVWLERHKEIHFREDNDSIFRMSRDEAEKCITVIKEEEGLAREVHHCIKSEPVDMDHVKVENLLAVPGPSV